MYSRPFPSEKNRRRGVCGAGGDCTQASQSVSSSSVKTAKDKILVSGVFNDSEGLYGTTFCRCLVRRPHYSARLLRFGSRGLSEFPPKCLDDRDCETKILYGFAARCLFGVVFLHNAKQGKLPRAVLTHKSLPHQRLTSHRFALKVPNP